MTQFSRKLCALIYICLCSVAIIESRQKYIPVEDFLLHESAGVTTAPKRDFVSSQFPALPPSKRDYVANQHPTLQLTSTTLHPATPTTQKSAQSNGKRDYVAPQHPTHKPSTGQTPSITIPSTNNPTQPNGKRDYVNPSHSTTQPAQQPGKVKDLINFYDKKDKNPPNVPSYSSILSGNGGQEPTSISTGNVQSVTPTVPKPLSFSSIVAGTNKQGQKSTSSAWGNVFTTAKPPSTVPHKSDSTTANRITPTPRPLPSSFVNKNKNQDSVVSSGTTSDSEIEVISEELLRKDSNNAAKYITINYQEKTYAQSKDDKAPLPLLSIPENVWNIPTIQKFVPLLDNYERDTLVNEYVTPQEKNEENAFMDAIMSTAVIRHLMNFLKVKGFVTPDPKQQRDFLKQLWFSLYSRGRGKIGSSGFEHIFVSELKNGEVSGLHNWIYFAREETANRLNYLGYMKYAQLSDKGAVLKMHFNQQGVDKPVDTMFVGTSPELEIALYTLCFITRADKDCKLKLGGKDVFIVSHTFRYRSKNLIGSAYPQI